MLDRPTRGFLSAIDDAVIVLGSDGAVRFLNGAAQGELAGIELLGRTLENSFPEFEGSEFQRAYQRARDTQQTQRFEAFFAPVRSWYEVRATPVCDDLVVFFRNVTARRRARQWSDARNRSLDLLVNQAGVGIVQTDRDLKITIANGHFASIMQRQLFDLPGKDFIGFFHEEDRELLIDRCASAITEDAVSELEVRLASADAPPRWCAIKISAGGEADEVSTCAFIVQDITESRANKLHAEESSTLLQTILDSAEDLIFVKDVDGRFVLINRALADAAPSLLGRTAKQEYGDAIGEQYEAFDRSVIETGEVQTAEEIIPIKGERRIFQTIKVPWLLNGEMHGVIGISRDLTDRHEAEERLRINEERYRLASRATNDAIWDWDLTTDQISWNEAIERLAGEKPDQSGSWWKDRIEPRDRERVLGSLDQFARGELSTWQCEYGFRHADGNYRTVFDRGFIVRDDRGTPIRMIGAMSDLTERMTAHRRVLQLQSELIHVSRVSAMGTIASALAHEINQPLASISNYVMGARRLLLEEGAAAREEVRGALEAAAAQVTRAGEIIRRIRRMVAHGQVESQAVPVRSLFDDALALALPNADLIGIEISFGQRGGVVSGDAVQLQQVLVNLIRNAMEAMEHSSRRILRLSSRRRAAEVRIEVEDSGCGISPERKDTLFNAFGTSKRNGLGVGLTICRTIVEAHGGRIWVEKTSALGTHIAITLPARSEDRGE